MLTTTGVPCKLGEALVEGFGAAVEQLVRLLADRGKLGRGALERRGRLLGGELGVGVAGAVVRSARGQSQRAEPRQGDAGQDCAAFAGQTRDQEIFTPLSREPGYRFSLLYID